MSGLATVEEALAALRAGRPVLVTDDEHRENEGDVVLAAEVAYDRERWPELALPNSEWNSARLCSIPLFPDMTLADVDRVVGAIEDLLEKGA